jgi:Conjugal transfer protein TraD
MALDQRKADTRHKIQLGGIVVKAGAGGIDAYALLGLLVEQSTRLKDPAEQVRLRNLGREFANRSNNVEPETVNGLPGQPTEQGTR